MTSEGLFKQMRGLAKVVTQRGPSWPCGLEIGTIVNEGGIVVEPYLPILSIWPKLLEEWFALTSVNYHGNL